MGGLAHGGIAQGNRVDAEAGYWLAVGSRLVGTPRIGFSGVLPQESWPRGHRNTGRAGATERRGSIRATIGAPS